MFRPFRHVTWAVLLPLAVLLVADWLNLRAVEAQGQPPTPIPTITIFLVGPMPTPTSGDMPQLASAPPATATPLPSPTRITTLIHNPQPPPLDTTGPGPQTTASPAATPVPTVALTGKPLAGKRVLLDPGHGGSDPGALYNGLREAVVNLKIAQQLRPILERLGAYVVLTRSDLNGVLPAQASVEDELQARAALASTVRADVLVSIHADAHVNPEVSGVVTFYGPEDGYLKISTRSPRLVARSSQLAHAIQGQLVATTDQRDRRVRRAPYWVLGAARVPAALVEVGVLTNTTDAQRLADPAFREQIATGIAKGIVAYVQNIDDAVFIRDLNVPDGTVVGPGQPFVKTWLLKNVGSKLWSTAYRLVHRSGDRLGAAEVIPLPHQVPPGQEVAISVPMVAPQKLSDPRSEWQLQDAFGRWIGDRVWAQIVVGRVPLPTDRAPRIEHPEFIYFEETGHNIGFAFRKFFEAHGGVALFGYPRTEEFKEDGLTVQYFQRARFEYHPEHAGTPYVVQLTLLGDLLTRGRQPFPRGQPFESGSEHRYFPETGYGVHFAFLKFFTANGGIDLFGYPISEEFRAQNSDGSGRAYTVQYFQRARFEYHPEHAGTPYVVQLGLLGDERLRRRGWLLG